MREYTLIRSSRKTLSLEITPDLAVIVRAPRHLALKKIDAFVESKEAWICLHLEKMHLRQQEGRGISELSPQERDELALKARKIIPERVAYYASMIGVTYGTITIRNQKTRWGSCSAKGNLSFNCQLMRFPMEVVDYVVVHELCHRLEMNHSASFWAQVERVLPDYQQRRAQLK